MKCEDVRVLLAAYRRSEWTIEDQRAISKHLATCTDCRRWEVEARRVGEQLRQLPTITPPSSLRERVFAAIKEDQLAAASAPVLVAATERKTTEPTPITAAKSASISPVRVARPTPISTERIGEVGGSRHAPRVLLGTRTAIATVAALFVIVFAIRFLPQVSTNRQTGPGQACVACQPIQGQHSFVPNPSFATVISAVADRDEAVYVGKSGDGKEMLFVSSFSNKQSTPLLSAPTDKSLAIITLTPKLVIWSEGDTRNTKDSWAIYALPLVNGKVQPAGPQPILLAGRGSYLQGDVSPEATVNSLWASGQSAVLVLTTQDNRTLLVRADLSDGGIAFADTTLARAQTGHTFIDPYIDDDAAFWVDMTIATGGQMQRTIWRQANQQNATPQQISPAGSDAFGPVANGQNVAWVQTNENVSTVNSVGGTVTATVNIVASNGSGTPQTVSAAPISITAATSVMRGDGYIFWTDHTGDHLYSPGAGEPTNLAGSIPQNAQLLGLSANAIVYANPGSTAISVAEIQ
jgi:hypothetical protein